MIPEGLNRVESYIGWRRTGRTTRLADEAIQTLFKEGEVRLIDHHPTRQAALHLFKIVVTRLSMEHPWVKADKNQSSLTIKLK